MAEDDWITKENIKRYRAMLDRESNPAARARIQELLDKEESKLGPDRQREADR